MQTENLEALVHSKVKVWADGLAAAGVNLTEAQKADVSVMLFSMFDTGVAQSGSKRAQLAAERVLETLRLPATDMWDVAVIAHCQRQAGMVTRAKQVEQTLRDEVSALQIERDDVYRLLDSTLPFVAEEHRAVLKTALEEHAKAKQDDAEQKDES